MKEVFAVYVWSNQWWTFSSDSWNSQAFVYGDTAIVDQDGLDWSKVSGGEAYHASLYYEIGKEDAHGFTPTRIEVNDIDNPTSVIISGEQWGRSGGDDYQYEIGLKDYYEALDMVVEFTVDAIIAAVDEDAKETEIVGFIESQNESDMALVESMSAETFNAPRKTPSKRQMRRSNRSRKSKNIMQQKRFMKDKRPKDYSTTGYAETLAAESFASESASDNIAAESSRAVEGVNPTPVSDGQWLAETVSKQAEAKHSYPHRVIDKDDYVHYDGKGRQTGRTNRGKSIKADRRRYTPNSNLKPGQGHRGDFVRAAQGYNDRMDESLGMSHRGGHSQTMGDRRRESAGMERSMNRRKYSRVGTMDRGDRFMSEGYNARLDESMGERNRGRHHGNMTMKDRRDMSEGMARHMGGRKYSNVGTMDRNNRMRAESAFKRLRAESPMTSPEEFSPMGSFSTDMNPKTAAPTSAGTGDQIVSVDSPSAPPSNIKFAETKVRKGLHKCAKCQHWNRNVRPGYTKCKKCGHGKFKRVKGTTKRSEFGVVGSGSNFGQDLEAENWCTKHSETFEACGCEKEDKRAEPSGSQPTNEMASGVDPLDDTTLSGFDIVNVDSPSAPPSDVFVQSAEMNYDGSLYGDQYFPDAMTANQVGVGKLGSANSAPDSGQGVLQWDGSRDGPNPDTKAAEILSRRNLSWVASIAAVLIGGKMLGIDDKIRDIAKKE